MIPQNCNKIVTIIIICHFLLPLLSAEWCSGYNDRFPSRKSRVQTQPEASRPVTKLVGLTPYCKISASLVSTGHGVTWGTRKGYKHLR